MFKTVNDLSDVVSHLIYCTNDNTILFTIGLKNSNEHHLPSIKNPPGISWLESSKRDLIDIFDSEEVQIHCLLRHCRVWIPNHDPQFISHMVFGVRCDSAQKLRTNNPKVRYRGKLKWLNENEVLHSLRNNTLASPEIVELLYRMLDVLKIRSAITPVAIESMPDNFNVIDNFVELPSELVTIPEKSLDLYDQMIIAANIKRDTTNLIYREFLKNCFPYLFMSFGTFAKFLVQMGWEHDGIMHLFRAADLTGRHGITYKEFLYILTVIDPTVTHRGMVADLRYRYMFRYFDENNDAQLNYAEFKKFILSIRRVRNESLNTVVVAHEIDGFLKSLDVNTQSCNIPMPIFLKFIADLPLRDLSAIFRSSVGIQHFIYDLQERERSAKEPAKHVRTSSARHPPPESNITELALSEIPVRVFVDYSLAVHTIRLQKNPMKVNIDEIFAMVGSVSDVEQLQSKMNPTKRTMSFDAFNQKSQTNQLLKMLRYMQQSSVPHLDSSVTNMFDYESFGKNLMKLCEQVRNILRNEPRLIEIPSPVYVLGDLHGNYSDLVFFEKILWHLGPSLCPANILFLGDYIDRGPCGVEVVAYLFAYKIQCPQKIYLLRGNHEYRNIQKLFTFENECNRKFGMALGRDVWNAVNSVFDVMPLAASIDSQIFCCHGGIPPPWLCPVINAINTIPTVLPEPNVQSPLAWEIMWNDPLQSEQLTETILTELIANEGFAANTRRGTGHIFSVQALERFLKINRYSHVIRAHEYAQNGFNIQLNGRLITVFSSSQYCGTSNEAACVIVDQKKLRLLRIATT